MKLSGIGLALSLTLLLTAAAGAVELPPPQAGYSWVDCTEIKGAFLLPAGWYFKKGRQGDTLGYFFTRENIDERGEFLTGLSVNVIPDIPQKRGMLPSAFAAAFVRTAAGERDVLRAPWTTTMGPFTGFGVVLLNRDAAQGDFITHNLAIANDETGTLYLLVFESPRSAWEESRAIAEPMLQRFLLDDSI